MSEQIVSSTGGVPPFVEELTRAILESEAVRDAGDRYELTKPFPLVGIPATLRDSLTARLDNLSPFKEVAQIGAVIGRSFTYEILAAVSPLPERRLHEALRRLTEAELIYPRNTPLRTEFAFRHALIRDIAYDSLLRARRWALHIEIARVLEEQLPGLATNQPEVLAHHYTAGGDHELAVEYWLRAAKRSAGQSSSAEAIVHYEKALEALRALPATRERARRELAIRIAVVTPTMSLKGYGSQETEAAIAVARTLAEELGETSEVFPIMYGEWVSTFARGNIKTSHVLVEQFRSIAERQPDTVPRIVAHRMLGATLANLGEFSLAREDLERCVSLFEPRVHGSAALVYGQDSRVSALSFLSWVLLVKGFPEEALSAAGRAIAFADESEHGHTQAVALCLSGLIGRAMMRDVHGVQDHASRALALSEQQGLAMWLQAATIIDGWLAAKLGRAADGLQRMRAGLDGLKSVGVGIVRPFFLSLVAEVCCSLGQVYAGLAAVSEALSLVEHGGERICEADLHRLRGVLLMTRGGPGSHASGKAALLRALAIARGQGARYWELRAATALAKVWSKHGDPERARALFTPLRPLLECRRELPDLQSARSLLRKLDQVGSRPSPTGRGGGTTRGTARQRGRGADPER